MPTQYIVSVVVMSSNSMSPFASCSSRHYILPRYQHAIPQVMGRLRPRRQSRAPMPQQRLNIKGRKSRNDRAFQYEPLDPAKCKIRLFELWPGNPGSKVVGRLFNVSLDEIPSFEALSYTWGSPQPTYNITINGHRIFPMRRNLRKALDDLRQPDKSLVLWKNAIYINQPNNAKKDTPNQADAEHILKRTGCLRLARSQRAANGCLVRRPCTFRQDN